MAALYANEESMNSAKDAAARRAEILRGGRRALPQIGADPNTADAARRKRFPVEELRAQLIEDGKHKGLNQLDGYASVTDRPYEMWDWIGPYTEIVDGAAFDETLTADPDVSFLVNHTGMTMARTTNGTLELEVDGLGLHARAFVNPKRNDVRDLVVAIDDKNITEMSFAFWITEGEWNEDYTEFRILKVNLDRGDVSAVTYGANPHTSIGARSEDFLADIDRAPLALARAAFTRLQRRPDLAAVTPPGPVPPSAPTGRSVALVRGMLHLLKEQE